MTAWLQNDEPQGANALRSAEAALLRIRRHAEAAQDAKITAAEAVEQILDELAAHPSLGRVRDALGHDHPPSRPH